MISSKVCTLFLLVCFVTSWATAKPFPFGLFQGSSSSEEIENKKKFVYYPPITFVNENISQTTNLPTEPCPYYICNTPPPDFYDVINSNSSEENYPDSNETSEEENSNYSIGANDDEEWTSNESYINMTQQDKEIFAAFMKNNSVELRYVLNFDPKHLFTKNITITLTNHNTNNNTSTTENSILKTTEYNKTLSSKKKVSKSLMDKYLDIHQNISTTIKP